MAQRSPLVAPALVDGHARRLAKQCYPKVLSALRAAFSRGYTEEMRLRWRGSSGNRTSADGLKQETGSHRAFRSKQPGC